MVAQEAFYKALSQDRSSGGKFKSCSGLDIVRQHHAFVEFVQSNSKNVAPSFSDGSILGDEGEELDVVRLAGIAF